MTSLGALEFSDLYLAESGEGGFLLERPGELPVPMPHACLSDALQLIERSEQEQRREFALVHDDVRYRVSQIPDILGAWWHFRRMPARVWSLEECGVPSRLRQLLIDAGRDHGAVLIGGKTGVGKTWSAGATLLAWVDEIGGNAFGIESPIELPLAGWRGRGRIFQRDVPETQFAEELVAVLRVTPRFLLLGETRRRPAARELLLAAANGHAVLSTVHCGSIIDGLVRLAGLAAEPGVPGGRDAALEDLAQGLSVFLHQQLEKVDGRWRPRFEVLFTSRDPSDPVRVLLRDGKLQELSTHIHNHTRMLTGGEPCTWPGSRR